MPRTLWELSDIPNIKLLWEEVSFEETLPMMLSNDGKGRKFRRVISRKTKSMVILPWFSEDTFIFFLEYLCVGFFNYFLNIYYSYLCIYLAAPFFHSQGAKQVLLSSLELLLSLPPRLDPMPTANSQSRALQPPKTCGRDHPSEASGVSPGKHQENMEAAAPKGSPSMTLHH